MTELFSSSWMVMNNNTLDTASSCSLIKDGYGRVDWMYNIFGECVHTPKEQFAFWIGILSICFWCVASLPQIMTNYRNRSATGLSLGLLILWASGDGTNLLACMLLQPLFMQVTIASYYVMTDTILIWQYFYYKSVDHQRRNGLQQQVMNELGDEFIDDHTTRNERHSNRTRIRSLLIVVLLIVPSALYLFSGSNASASILQEPSYHLSTQFRDSSSQKSKSFVARKLLAATVSAENALRLNSVSQQLSSSTTTTNSQSRYQWPPRGFQHIFGYIVACISSILYLGARRGSTRGMNPLLFFCTIMGNFTYAMSICLYSSERDYLLFQIPWLVGSLGVLLLDMAILGQVILFEFLVPKLGGGNLQLSQDEYRLVGQEDEEADLESDLSLQ